MSLSRLRFNFYYWSLLLVSACGILQAQDPGTITGTVKNSAGEPVHHATVLVVQTGVTVETDHDGEYRIESIPPGTYDIFAQAASFTSQARLVTVAAGESAVGDGPQASVRELGPPHSHVGTGGLGDR